MATLLSYTSEIMRFIRLLFCALCIPMTALAVSAPAGDALVQKLTGLNDTLQSATKNYDDSTLKKLITDDYELVSSSGKVYDRAAFLADAVDKSAKYEINQPEDVSVHHYNDDCAIVTAVLHIRYKTADKVVDVRVRYGDVWVKLNGQWRYAYGQASPMKKPS